MAKDQKEKSSLSASFKLGAVALAFMIIGYQTALFVRQAAVTRIADRMDSPDTVYVITRAAAESLSARIPEVKEEFNAASDTSRLVIRTSGRRPPETEAVRQAVAERTYDNFPFDPNTATVEDLQRLGFSAKQAASIRAYCEKGGRFHRKTDFQKSYVVPDSVYRRLEPYISIPRLDINAADSAAFDALPGIGPYFAAKMVSYRAELHGYSFAGQLMDIWKFDEERFAGLADLIVVGPAPPYPIWTLPEDSLRLHPYIRSYAAHGIVLFRENSPRESWTVEALKRAGILDPDVADKLARCNLEMP